MRALQAEGVKTIFGYPGGSIMPVYDALYDYTRGENGITQGSRPFPLYVEVKGNNPEWVPYIKDAFAKQTKATPKNVLFITFGEALCAELKRQMPEYKAYWLTGPVVRGKDGKPIRNKTADEIIAKLKELGADGIVPAR